MIRQSVSPDLSSLSAIEAHGRCAICVLVSLIQNLPEAEARKVIRTWAPPDLYTPFGEVRYTTVIPPAGNDPGYIHATAGPAPIACLQFRPGPGGTSVTGISVLPDFRRHGIASELFLRARAAAGGYMDIGPDRTAAGAAWVKSLDR